MHCVDACPLPTPDDCLGDGQDVGSCLTACGVKYPGKEPERLACNRICFEACGREKFSVGLDTGGCTDSFSCYVPVEAQYLSAVADCDQCQKACTTISSDCLGHTVVECYRHCDDNYVEGSAEMDACNEICYNVCPGGGGTSDSAIMTV